MNPQSAESLVKRLLQENSELREEVRVSRRASDITAQLVVEQFVRIDEMLKRLEERSAAEQKLGRELGEQLREAEQREQELAREREQLHGMQIAAVNMMEDIAAARLAAEAATQAKSDFLANMSHEIRTPMTAILGFTDVLLDHAEREGCSSAWTEAAGTIKRNGMFLLGIINDILDLSKIEAGKLKMERIPCEPCRLLAEVASLMNLKAGERGLEFKIEYDGAIPETILTDPTRLRQILINVIGNAIKFTATGSVTVITSICGTGDEHTLQFDIVDTGLGMNEEQIRILFQPFTQADSSTTRKYGGTGLGLAISKRFAELLGGDLVVVNTAVGAGTRFRLTISTGSLEGVKLIEEPASATVVESSEGTLKQESWSPDSTALQDTRILLVEDGYDNQRLISHVLTRVGAHVTVLENGKLAVESALAARDQDNPFDVILMDMQMPVMDGYQATSMLRQQNYSGLIIALTANAMAGDRLKCMNAGCDCYATKPIDRQHLIQIIQDQLRCVAIPKDQQSDSVSS